VWSRWVMIGRCSSLTTACYSRPLRQKYHKTAGQNRCVSAGWDHRASLVSALNVRLLSVTYACVDGRGRIQSVDGLPVDELPQSTTQLLRSGRRRHALLFQRTLQVYSESVIAPTRPGFFSFIKSKGLSGHLQCYVDNRSWQRTWQYTHTE